MATYYSNIYHGAKVRTACEAGEGGFVQIRGRLEIPVGKAPASTDILKLFILPANCYLLRIAISNNSWGTTVPLNTLGNETSATAIIGSTDLALETARGYGTAAPHIRVNDSFTADTAWTASASIFAFNDATCPPSASDEDIVGVLGSVTAGSTSGCWLSFAAEIYVPDARTTFGGGTQYTWNGTSAGLGNAST